MSITDSSPLLLFPVTKTFTKKNTFCTLYIIETQNKYLKGRGNRKERPKKKGRTHRVLRIEPLTPSLPPPLPTQQEPTQDRRRGHLEIICHPSGSVDLATSAAARRPPRCLLQGKNSNRNTAHSPQPDGSGGEGGIQTGGGGGRRREGGGGRFEEEDAGFVDFVARSQVKGAQTLKSIMERFLRA